MLSKLYALEMNSSRGNSIISTHRENFAAAGLPSVSVVDKAWWETSRKEISLERPKKPEKR
jgi:hypothetical protein